MLTRIDAARVVCEQLGLDATYVDQIELTREGELWVGVHRDVKSPIYVLVGPDGGGLRVSVFKSSDEEALARFSAGERTDPLAPPCGQ